MKPKPTPFVSAKSIQRGDPPWVPQENLPQGNALQVDASKPTDAVAASSPAAAKPIEQGDAPSVPQENVPQGNALQVDASKPTDAVAASSPAAAKPIEQGDAPSVSQENVPQGNALQVDASKPTDAVAVSSPAAAKPIEQGDPPSVSQENIPQESALQVDGSKPTDAVAASSPAAAKPIEQGDAPSISQQNDGSKPTDAGVASSPATPTFRVAALGADSTPPDADAEAFGDGRRIAERSTPTTKADIVRGLSFKPVQIFLLLVFGVAIIVFLVSLVILMHHRVPVEFQVDHDRPEARAHHGLQDDRADARSSQMFVDNGRGQDRVDSPPWRVRPSAMRPQNGDATSTEPRRSSVEDVKAALEDFKVALIYEDRTQRFRQGPEVTYGTLTLPAGPPALEGCKRRTAGPCESERVAGKAFWLAGASIGA